MQAQLCPARRFLHGPAGHACSCSCVCRGSLLLLARLVVLGISTATLQGPPSTCHPSRHVSATQAVLEIITNPVNSTVPIAAEVLKSMGAYDPKKASSRRRERASDVHALHVGPLACQHTDVALACWGLPAD
jgi:hypothetical protein